MERPRQKHSRAETGSVLSIDALVTLSGGQDSTTCLYWAIRKFGQDKVESITFDYGQRHRVEIECAKTIADEAGIANTVIPIDTFSALSGNALTDCTVQVVADTKGDELPNTFVPGRNIIFLTYAAAYAWPREIGHLVTGVAQTDYSGYPDCREETIDALQTTLQLGMESDVEIHTPLMHLSKRDTVILAQELGAIGALALTQTCYEGERPPCGECPACRLRAKGFAEAGLDDPLLAR